MRESRADVGDGRGNPCDRLAWGALAMAFAALLVLFTCRYVPRVLPYQAVLFPWVIGTGLWAAVRPRVGTLIFLFSFPLINNLPYFFGLDEKIAQAPAALVLVLFFLLGLVSRQAVFPRPIRLDNRLFKPALIFCGVVLVSTIITVFRFANFFPFLSDRIYDLIVSVIGVTSGAAIMASIGYALSYLTALAVFFVAWRLFEDGESRRQAIRVLFASACISLAFGLVQSLGDVSLGNSPIRASVKTINATFKDPNSFGAFLAMILPLSLGLFIARRGATRVLAGALFASGIVLLSFTGSGSGLLGVLAALATLLSLMVIHAFGPNARRPSTRNIVLGATGVALALVLVAGSLVVFNQSMLFYKISRKVVDMQKGSSFDEFLHNRWSINWQDGLSMARDYPFTGVGLGAYTVEVPNYAEKAKKSLPIGESAENYPIQVLSETGIPGLLLSLWVFWELVKQVMRRRALPFAGRDRFLFYGAVGALVSYALNLQFHTYIGSYEIKYLFWTIAALALRLPTGSSPEAGPPPSGRLFTKRGWTAAAAFLAVFASLHLWNSTHSLSIASRTRIFHLKQAIGLYPAEKAPDGSEFHWTRGYGGFPVKVEKPVIELTLLASHPDIVRRPVRVTVLLVRDFFKRVTRLGEIVFRGSAWETYDFSLEGMVGEEAILLLKVDRTWNPLKAQGVPDPRDLGVVVGAIRFRDPGLTADPGRPIAKDD